MSWTLSSAVFGVSLLVGAFYAVVDVRSPAPPPAALVGLLGMVSAATLFGAVR